MRVLVVGGAGKVASIIRPALEAEHEMTVFDRVAVPELGERGIVGDVNDDPAVARAVDGMDAIIYMPMGVGNSGRHGVQDIDAAFDVNVQGFYRFLALGLKAGVMRYVYASSLSVYQRLWRRHKLDERIPADGWDAYGMSKRLGERLCAAAAQREPRAVIVALRLCMPVPEEYARHHPRRKRVPHAAFTFPHDLRAIFLSALACPHPGSHVVHATGDAKDELFCNDLAAALLGYRPEGR